MGLRDRLLVASSLGMLLVIGAVSWWVWLHPQPQRSEAIKVVAAVCRMSLQATPTELVQTTLREDHNERAERACRTTC
jgi:hypothetical protein